MAELRPVAQLDDILAAWPPTPIAGWPIRPIADYPPASEPETTESAKLVGRAARIDVYRVQIRNPLWTGWSLRGRSDVRYLERTRPDEASHSF